MYLDRAATLRALRDVLTDLADCVSENQQLLFYFAGHGFLATLPVSPNIGIDDGPQGYFLPQDARQDRPDTWLLMTDVYKALTRLPCRHILTILDCCFAGAFGPVRRNINTTLGTLYRQRYERYVEERTWHLLASASYDERALDHEPDLRTPGLREPEPTKHSPFAAALLDGLEGGADLDADGLIQIAELHLFIEKQFADLEQRWQRRVQRPILCKMRSLDKGEYVFLHPARPLQLPEAMPLTATSNPYRGLNPYNEEDRRLFFGRDAAAAKIADHAETVGLTVVRGPSGCGKSSLVRAGVVPQLRRRGYHIATPLRPGEHPLEVLNRSIVELPEQDARSVLVIDQLEEVVTLCRSQGERALFFTRLRTLLGGSCRIIVTVRADFEATLRRLATAHGLAAAWEQGKIWVPPMSRDELRMVIEQPAAECVLFFEPKEFVDKLTDEVAQMPAALPLLSFVLSELYRVRLENGRTERTLLMSEFDKLGGVIGALSQRIEQIYSGLATDDLHEQHVPTQGTMRRLLLRLISVEHLERTRRQVPPWELVSADGVENDRIEALKKELIAARLLVSGTNHIEAAHDALVRNYPQLDEWIEREYGSEDNLLLQRRLSESAWDYKQNRGQLWAEDQRLPSAILLDERRTSPLCALESDFVRRSVARKRASRRAWRLAASTFFVVVSTVAALALWQYLEARHRLEDAISVTRLIHFEADRSLRTVAGAAGVRREILRASAELMERLLLRQKDDPDLLRARLVGHQQRADLALHAEGKQNLDAAQKEYEAAERLAKELTRRDPNNLLWQDDLAVTCSGLGEIAELRGELQRAKELYAQDLQISQLLVARDPTDLESKEHLAVAHSKSGELAMREGRLSEAHASYEAALKIREALLAQAPTLARQRQLAVSLRDLGVAAARQGRLAEARTGIKLAIGLILGLLAKESGNAEWKYELAIYGNDLGRLEEQAGSLPAAEAAYRQSEQILRALVSAEASNGSWRRTLASVQSSLGDVLIKRVSLRDARVAYQEALTNTQGLTQMDPTNARWQGDLATAYDKIGELEELENRQARRLEAYKQAWAIRTKLVERDPTSLERKSDLAISIERLAEIDEEEGHLEAALDGYGRLLRLREEIRQRDPKTLLWSRNLAIAHAHLAHVWQRMIKLPETEEAYRLTLSILKDVVKAEPENTEYVNDLAATQMRLGDVLETQGQFQPARALYEEALALRKKLVRDQPEELEWQRNLAGAYNNLGSLASSENKYEAARAAYQEGISILERLVKVQPKQTLWRRELSTLYGNLGDLELAEKHYPLAERAYQVDYFNTNFLAEAELGKAAWRRDLMLSHARQAVLYMYLKKRGPGCQHLRQFDQHRVALARAGGLEPSERGMIGLIEQLVPVRTTLRCQEQ